MKKIKHFVPNKDSFRCGVPACDCYSFGPHKGLYAFIGEVAKTRRQVTCKNCKRTKAFRKLK